MKVGFNYCKYCGAHFSSKNRNIHQLEIGLRDNCQLKKSKNSV